MRRIQHAMDETANGNHVHAVPGGPLEIRNLAENFNRMLEACTPSNPRAVRRS